MDMPNTIRALIVEDIEDDALLLVNALKRAGMTVFHQRVENLPELETALKKDWDIVFSDYTLPGFNGLNALDVVRRHNSEVPFIFVSGTIGEDRAVAAVRSGASDYIIKGNYARLPIATQRVLEEARIRRENRLAKLRIDQLINVDVLTNLASRGKLLETLHGALDDARASGGKVGIVLVNVDNFRTINEMFGMKGGDQMIMDLAHRLKGAVGVRGLVGREYADQFSVVVPEIHSHAQLEELANDVLACFDEPFPVHRYTKSVTGSVGIALYPDDGHELQELLNNVNLAQKLAKNGKGNTRLRYSRDARRAIEHRMTLEAELETAIRNEDFVLHYQPQMNTSTGRVVAAESLVRWKHPRHGFVSPMEFIPVAEQSGLILQLGELICRLACRQIRDWKRQGLPPLPIAINVSSLQFQEPGFAPALHDIMKSYGVEPERIELEITETALMQDPDAAHATLEELRGIGVKIALDDFGTGYSSMSYLDRFPIDVLKIDRAFISDFPQDSRKVAIVNAIISIADKLSMKVVAEGVETAEQLEFLRELGCEIAQGYYIHRPADAADVFPALLGGKLALPARNMPPESAH